jgi:hypothetical protein
VHDYRRTESTPSAQQHNYIRTAALSRSGEAAVKW